MAKGCGLLVMSPYIYVLFRNSWMNILSVAASSRMQRSSGAASGGDASLLTRGSLKHAFM
jgi:hypothetical protein